jgi:hypothetical protein
VPLDRQVEVTPGDPAAEVGLQPVLGRVGAEPPPDHADALEHAHADDHGDGEGQRPGGGLAGVERREDDPVGDLAEHDGAQHRHDGVQRSAGAAGGELAGGVAHGHTGDVPALAQQGGGIHHPGDGTCSM